MRRQHAIQTQRGAAILLAMLILVLITSLAAGSTWRQSQVLEVEAAERDRSQAVWILNGMLDWSRLILKEDDKNKEREDNLDETPSTSASSIGCLTNSDWRKPRAMSLSKPICAPRKTARAAKPPAAKA